MTKSSTDSGKDREVKTGRRSLSSFEARDKTVCFILSESEKNAVDRLGFCMNITRSGLLARIVTEFVNAAEDSKAGRNAEKAHATYLTQCRQAVKARGTKAAEFVAQQTGAKP